MKSELSPLTDSQVNLAKEDAHFHKRNYQILDMRTPTESKAQNINFKILVKVLDQSIILAEIDPDSHLSLITEKYFEEAIKPLLPEINYLPEPPPNFRGMGGGVYTVQLPPSTAISPDRIGIGFWAFCSNKRAEFFLATHRLRPDVEVWNVVVCFE